MTIEDQIRAACENHIRNAAQKMVDEHIEQLTKELPARLGAVAAAALQNVKTIIQRDLMGDQVQLNVVFKWGGK